MLRQGETWTFAIPYATPSQNETDRMHWAARSRLQKDFTWELKTQLASTGHAGVLLMQGSVNYRVSLHIQRHSCRTLDLGNMVGGLKSFIDSFVKLGLIKDDSPQWLTDTYEQVKVKRKMQCTIFALSRP